MPTSEELAQSAKEAYSKDGNNGMAQRNKLTKGKIAMIVCACVLVVVISLGLGLGFGFPSGTYNGMKYHTANGKIMITDHVGNDSDVVVPNRIMGKKVTQIKSYAFYECTNLKSIVIGSNITNIGSAAFWGCSNLQSVTIPNSVTIIDSYTFLRCSSLQSITIPNGVRVIGEYAFSNCSGLQSVTIPDSVTSIGNFAFSECYSLTSVVIGSGVTRVGIAAFNSYSNLTVVYYNGTSEDWDKIDFAPNNLWIVKTTICYYSETAPTASGNYWHYDTDGVTPVRW